MDPLGSVRAAEGSDAPIDMDLDKVGCIGASFGASAAVPFLALEPHLKATTGQGSRVMNNIVVTAAIGVLAFVPTLAQGQVVSSLASFHSLPEQAITATADVVSEDLYSFRPTDEVRTLGQILAHIANSNYGFCSRAAGEDNPNAENFEETKTTKAQITQALAVAFTYCRGVYANMTDEKGSRDGEVSRGARLCSIRRPRG